MPEKGAKAKAEPRGVYKVSTEHNDRIREDDDFKGRLTDRDWALFLGQGDYLVLKVKGYEVTGKPAYRFRAAPLGQAVRWHPTEHEANLLRAGLTIEAPVALDTLIAAPKPYPFQTRPGDALASSGG